MPQRNGSRITSRPNSAKTSKLGFIFSGVSSLSFFIPSRPQPTNLPFFHFPTSRSLPLPRGVPYRCAGPFLFSVLSGLDLALPCDNLDLVIISHHWKLTSCRPHPSSLPSAPNLPTLYPTSHPFHRHHISSPSFQHPFSPYPPFPLFYLHPHLSFSFFLFAIFLSAFSLACFSITSCKLN